MRKLFLLPLALCLLAAAASAEEPSVFLPESSWVQVAEGVWFQELPQGGGQLYGKGAAGFEWLRETTRERLAGLAEEAGSQDPKLRHYYEMLLADAARNLSPKSLKLAVASASGPCSPSASAGPYPGGGAQASASISCNSAQGLTTSAYVRANGSAQTYTGATWGTNSWASGWRAGTTDCYAEGYASSASGYWAQRWYSGCY